MPEATPREKELSEALARSTAENAQLMEEQERLRTETRLLREKIAALLARLFGAQSEKLDREQLLLMLHGKIPGARGRGGTTALDGSIASA
jgi:hypothetical protein